MVFPTLKPHSLFTYQAQVLHAGEIIAWWKTYESYVAKALKHFAVNPVDLNDPAFKFTGKELGLSGRAFDYVTESMARYGLSLEQVAREAHKRRLTDPNARLLSLDQYRALAAQSQNEITLEANISTRAPAFVVDAKGQLVAPFLGWAVSKGYDAWRGFREPNGKASWRAFGTGLLPYIAILPIGLAYALMRDKYDEEIVGRKQNVRDLTTIKDGKDAFLTVLDNAARMGTFGILGEVPNKFFNYDTQRDFSLDNRILFVNSLLATMKATGDWVHQGNADWATVGRPMFQALGGSGYLQYADILNNQLGLDNAEARVSKRISVNNYLRVTGRELDMDVRASRSSGAMPNPLKPYIGQMVMAAMANNAADFKSAWRAAVQEAIDQGDRPDAARDRVQRSYSSYHPLRVVFKTEPDENEFRQLLAAMNDDGRTTVATAVRMSRWHKIFRRATHDERTKLYYRSVCVHLPLRPRTNPRPPVQIPAGLS